MSHRIVQPTKEQVRAYMHARGRAAQPPPSPAEIREQLGWHIEVQHEQIPLVGFYLIPTKYSHVLLRLMAEWWVMRSVQLCTLAVDRSKISKYRNF